MIWVCLAAPLSTGCGSDHGSDDDGPGGGLYTCEDLVVFSRCDGSELVDEYRRYGADCGNEAYSVTSVERTRCESHCVEPSEGFALCAFEDSMNPACGEVDGDYCEGDAVIGCQAGYVTVRDACETGCVTLNEGKYGMAYCDEDLQGN